MAKARTKPAGAAGTPRKRKRIRSAVRDSGLVRISRFELGEMMLALESRRDALRAQQERDASFELANKIANSDALMTKLHALAATLLAKSAAKSAA